MLQPRTLSGRLTLLNAAVTSFCCLAALAVVIFVAERFMREHVLETVHAELNIMLSENSIDGLMGLRRLIALREQYRASHHRRVYRLETATGVWLAGALDFWPSGLQPDAVPTEISDPGDAEVTWIMAASQLPGGERLLVGVDRRETEHVQTNLRIAAAWGVSAAVIISLFSGWAVSRTVQLQIGTINRSAQRIMHGELGHRIPAAHPGDELDELARTLNRMLDRISELIAAIRNATDAIAHDLRSPLARHRATLEQALRHPPPAAEMQDWLHTNLAQLDQVLGTFNALLQIATVESGVLRAQFAVLDFKTIVSDAVEIYEAVAADRRIAIIVETAEGNALQVAGDRNLLFQSVANLLDNAIKFSPSNARIQVTLGAAADRIQLEVRDEGPGIPPDEQDRVFGRLVRLETSRSTPGHGLGLSLVRAVARLHGGECAVMPAERGACLRMTLPKSMTSS